MRPSTRFAPLLSLVFTACSPAPAPVADARTALDASDAFTPLDAFTPVDAFTPPDAPTPPACDRARDSHTAPVALLTALQSDLASLTADADRRARVDRFIADVSAAGGTPLEGNGEVVFVARGDGPWSVGLSTRDWMPAAAPMDNVAGTDLWTRHESLSPTTYAQYKLVQNGSNWQQDFLAQNVIWDGIDHNAPGEFNGVVHPAAGDANKGRLVAMRAVPSVADHDPRDVFVYLPAAYDRAPACPALPLVFVHDGNESLTRVPMQYAADTAFASGTRPAIFAFVALPSQDVRIDEYTFHTATARGDAYGHFLFDELEPRLTSRFRVRPGRDCRGLTGASLGGLISMYLAYTRPDRAVLVGAQSGSFFWDNSSLIDTVMTGAMQDLRVYLDSGDSGGSDDPDNVGVVTQLDMALAARGYDHTRVLEHGAIHDWQYWTERWPGMLQWMLRPGRCD